MDDKIPQIIHYIWFGKGPKSDLIEKCMKKNNDILKSWKFKYWTEDNYDIDKCRYLKEAYESKRYAFASDYARFDILYKYGGVYLDTDVELIKKIPDHYLLSEGFSGVEDNNKIAPGLIFACKPHNFLVKEILRDYENDIFLMENGKYNDETVVDRVTRIFKKYGFEATGSIQNVEGFIIYPCEVFCAYNFVLDEFNITQNTISIHHYTATWVPLKSKLKKLLQKIIRKICGKKIYLGLIFLKRKLLGENK